MRKIPLTELEMEAIKPGEAITITAIIAVMAIAIVAVIIYKLFIKDSGKVKLPGGYSFEWK